MRPRISFLILIASLLGSLNATASYPQKLFSIPGYDPAGRLASVTNANEEVTQFGYNPVGELTSLTDGRNNTKRWAYDIYGREIAETNAAGVLVKTFGYDANSRLTAQWTAAKGTSQLTYDNNGNLKSIIQPSSGTISYTYDKLDRLTGMSDGVGSSSFAYINWGAFRGALTSEDGPWGSDTVNYDYTSHKLTSIGLGSWSETIGYDAALRPETFVSSAGTFTYAFNGAGRQVASLTLPQNLVTNEYDAIGALRLREFKKGGTVLDSRGYAYDPVGLITNITRLNGVYAEYGYDPIGQLINAHAFEAGGAPRLNEQLGYAYDASHNLAYRTNNTLLQSFTSNSRNELANAVRAGTLTVSGSVTGAVASVGVNGNRAEIYSDQTFATTNGLTLQDGNNLFVTVGTNTGGTLVLSTKVATKLPATVHFSYDLNGNLLSDGLKGFDYDDANQLTRVTVTNGWKSEFAYDGLGRRRISKEYSWSGSAWTQTNEVRYVWDGMCVLQERDGGDAVQVTYTRGLDLSGTMQGAGGIGGLLARTDSSGTAYYHSDAGGNITTMTDSSGNVVARYLYDPFGNLLAKSGVMAEVNKYRFSTKEVHPNSGLYYYGFRFYEPNFQRWLNEDPIGIAGGMNLFGFVGNSPMNFLDPFGRVETSINSPLGQLAAPVVGAGISILKGGIALLGIGADTIAEEIFPAPRELTFSELHAQHGIFMTTTFDSLPRYDASLDPRWGDVAEGTFNAALLWFPCKGMKGSSKGAPQVAAETSTPKSVPGPKIPEPGINPASKPAATPKPECPPSVETKPLKPARQRGDRMTDADSTMDQLDDITKAQAGLKKKRQSLKNHPDWEDAKTRPKSNDIRSTKKSEDRARNNNYDADLEE